MQVHFTWENRFFQSVMSASLGYFFFFFCHLLSNFAFNCAVEMVAHVPQCISYCGFMGNLSLHSHLQDFCSSFVMPLYLCILNCVNKLISTCICCFLLSGLAEMKRCDCKWEISWVGLHIFFSTFLRVAQESANSLEIILWGPEIFMRKFIIPFFWTRVC